MAYDDTIKTGVKNTMNGLGVWNTSDADKVHEEYKASGATIVEDIETRPWGTREFVIEDPDGNRMRIGHVDESNSD